MDLNQLTPEEIDFELLLRNTTGIRGKNLEWKISRLQQLLDSEQDGSPAPRYSSHVVSDMDSIYHCQTTISPIFHALNAAFKQQNEAQVTSLRSRLLHYKFRLSLITEATILDEAKKSLTKICNALHQIDEFLNDKNIEHQSDTKDPEDLPSDPETLKRLKIAQLQSSIDEADKQQKVLQQELQRTIQDGQIPQRSPDQDNVFSTLQQQQQSHMQQQNPNPTKSQQQHGLTQQYSQEILDPLQHPTLSGQHQQQQTEQSQQRGFQPEQRLHLLLNQMQLQQQQLEQQLRQEQQRRQQLEWQLQHQQHQQSVAAVQQQANYAPNYTYGSISGYWGPQNQRESGIAQEPQRTGLTPPVGVPSRPNTPRSSNQPANSNRFLQPVHKWPFEYAGENNIVKLGEFLNQVNTYAVTEGMDDQALLRSIKHLLKGRALQWYTRSYLDLTTWEIFKAEIKQEFLPPNYSEIVKQDLYLRFQGPNEPFTNFYRDLVAAFEIIDPPITESEKLFILKSHLNSDFSPIASASRSGSVRELVSVCKDFEVSRSYAIRGRASTAARTPGSRPEVSAFQRPAPNRIDRNPVNNVNRFPMNRQPFGIAQVNMMELNQDNEEDLDLGNIREREAFQQDIALRNELAMNVVEEVNAMRTQNDWRARPADNILEVPVRESSNRDLATAVVCWQCDSPGHTYLRCPNPKRFLFCYSCGKKGCTTRNCDACILRWRQLETQNAPQVPGNRNWENPQ
ncbi:uncharacterized protein LOC109425487 [Aedes albopictus]|uniref:CCHC-type domain-containing protein n=1 Tax=Aedes albopictus TaxID=7160 RepID=A0ABM1Y9J4_AEDAL